MDRKQELLATVRHFKRFPTGKMRAIPHQPRMTSPKRLASAFVQFRFIEHHIPDGIASALVVLFRARVAERMLKVGVQHL
jgi:hypothetical protein